MAQGGPPAGGEWLLNCGFAQRYATVAPDGTETPYSQRGKQSLAGASAHTRMRHGERKAIRVGGGLTVAVTTRGIFRSRRFASPVALWKGAAYAAYVGADHGSSR